MDVGAFDMTDWIAWTKCRTCGYMDKDVVQKPDDPQLDATSHVRCPSCGNRAAVITFPVFEVQTIEIIQPGDAAMYDTIDDW